MDRHDQASNDLMNRLIGYCREGEYGFRTCAQHVRSAELRTLFARHSDACHAALEELQRMQEQNGGHVEPSAVQPLRTWASLRGKVTFDSDDQIVAEAVRGEAITVSRLAEALAAAVPPSLRELIERQLVAARRNEDELKRLVDQAAVTA